MHFQASFPLALLIAAGCYGAPVYRRNNQSCRRPVAAPVTGISTAGAAASGPVDFGKGIEGVSVSQDGTLFATDFKGGNKFSNSTAFGPLTPGSTFQPVFINGTLLNGSRFLKDGSVIIVDATGHQVFQVAKDGSKTNICTGAAFLQPNDMAISPDEQHLYFSGQNFTADTTADGKSGDIFHCNRATNKVDNAGASFYQAADIHRTNGIEVSPDGKFLYVSSAKNVNGTVVENKIVRFDRKQDNGSISTPKVFASFGDIDDAAIDIDGMRSDSQGNLWVTRNGAGKVVGLSPEGTVIQTVNLTQTLNPTNLEFGGVDGKTLTIVGRCQSDETVGCMETVKAPFAGRAFTELNA